MPMAWRARRAKLPGAVGMPIIDTAVLTGWIMFGRLFKFFCWPPSWCCWCACCFRANSATACASGITTLAQALLISSALFVAAYWLWACTDAASRQTTL